MILVAQAAASRVFLANSVLKTLLPFPNENENVNLVDFDEEKNQFSIF